MTTRVSALAAALALSAGAAAAADTRVTASLEQPVSAQTRVVAGGAVWNCQGSTCSAAAASSRSLGYRACKELVKKVGPVTAYGGRQPLEAEQLAKCNVTAKAPAAPGGAVQAAVN